MFGFVGCYRRIALSLGHPSSGSRNGALEMLHCESMVDQVLLSTICEREVAFLWARQGVAFLRRTALGA